MVDALRHLWLPIRARVIPHHSRRDVAYRALRAALGQSRQLLQSAGMPPEPPEYERFQALFEPSARDLEAQRARHRARMDGPQFGIVTAVFAPPLRIFKETAASVVAQTYPRWAWHVADATPHDGIWEELTALAEADDRIRPIRLPANGGMSANINAALREASGDFVVLLDHDDTLAPFALHAVAEAIATRPDADFLYSDCDKLGFDGRRCDPFFKPGWSPELLLCCNYLDQVAVIRRTVLGSVGGFDSAMDGAHDWDLYFRIAERTQAFHHVPQVLYHWRKTEQSTAAAIENKPEIHAAQRKAVLSHLRRRGVSHALVGFDGHHPVFSHFPRLTWRPRTEQRVSVVIPTLDHVELLETCLHGLDATAYTNREIVIVDTGSTERRTEQFYASLAGRPDIRILRYEGAFNFGRACNLGARHASGDLLLLLNNDIEVLHDDWLSRMAQWFELDGVGVVGPKMLYANGRMHHGGVTIGMGGLASILFLNSPEHAGSIFGPEGWYRNVSAVSGACLLTSKKLYEHLNGLDERFILNYSDVDYCLRANAIGRRVVVTPDARLIHHESATHGRRIPRTDFLEAARSFRPLIDRGDPYFNPNLSTYYCRPTFRRSLDDNPRHECDALLARLPHKDVIDLPHDLQPN